MNELFNEIRNIKKYSEHKQRRGALKVEEIDGNWLFVYTDELEIGCYFRDQHSIKAHFNNLAYGNEFELNLQFISW